MGSFVEPFKLILFMENPIKLLCSEILRCMHTMNFNILASLPDKKSHKDIRIINLFNLDLSK
jgi:hypothetical protein